MTILPIHSLTVKTGAVIILVEIVILSLTGALYITRFNQEVERRFESNIKIPGMLMAEGALKYSLVTDRHRMERLTGETLDEAILFGVAQQVFYSLRPEWMEKHAGDIPGIDPDWLRLDVREAFVQYVTDGPERFLMSVTPIFSLDGQPFIFLYLKSSTRSMEAEKAAITRLFLLGSAGTILATSLAIFLIFQRSIFARIQALLALFKRIEAGDLTARSTGRIAPDEIGRLQHGVNSMVARLQDMLTALQDSRQRYRAVVDDIPAMLCRFLPDGTITFCNDDYANYFQTDQPEPAPQNFFRNLPAAEREPARRHFSTLSPERPQMTYTQQFQAEDGQLYWHQWTGRALFNEPGELTEYQALGRDISDDIRAQQDRAELERQLHTAKKMEAIGTLAGGIAHDFNNILGGMIGYAELAEDEIDQNSSAARYIEQILKACHRAKELVIQILIFSRQGPTERQPLELESIVKETLKLVTSTLPDTIEIRYRSQVVEGMILANPTQIHQTFMNLFTNAVHAMQSTGGILEVQIDDIRIMGNEASALPDLPPGAYLSLSVSDSGPGMNPEMVQRIFDPYFSTKTPYEGTGLGLSICLGIVKSHGGTITVKSTPGEGSMFTVLLPKAPDAEAPETDGQPPRQNALRGRECILFVDDEEFLVDVGRTMLRQLGYTVVTALNGMDALHRFQAEPERFDLVITDQTMPAMTGAELATQLLQIRTELPIILCTGFSETMTEEQAEDLGIRQFLLKPISRQEMGAAVRAALDATP